jgi:hypothetical protein
LGMETSIPFRLCTRAPVMVISCMRSPRIRLHIQQPDRSAPGRRYHRLVLHADRKYSGPMNSARSQRTPIGSSRGTIASRSGPLVRSRRKT